MSAFSTFVGTHVTLLFSRNFYRSRKVGILKKLCASHMDNSSFVRLLSIHHARQVLLTLALFLPQVGRMKDEFHIYMTKNGRISMAGVTVSSFLRLRMCVCCVCLCVLTKRVACCAEVARSLNAWILTFCCLTLHYSHKQCHSRSWSYVMCNDCAIRKLHTTFLLDTALIRRARTLATLPTPCTSAPSKRHTTERSFLYPHATWLLAKVPKNTDSEA